MSKVNLHIIAAGRGTRIKSRIKLLPKALITINNEVVIDTIINGIGIDNIESLTIVINPYFQGDLIRKYINHFYKDKIKEIHYAVQPEPNGTADAVLRSLKRSNKRDNLFISWSDIVVGGEIKRHPKKCNVVYISDDIKCRYHFNEFAKVEFTKSDKGNVVGMFFFELIGDGFLTGLEKFAKDKKDFVDYLRDECMFGHQEEYIGNIIDVGDTKTLDNQIAKSSAYSEVIMKKNIVIKRYKRRIDQPFFDKEQFWYINAQHLVHKTPEILDIDPHKQEITMRRIKEKPLNKKAFVKILNSLVEDFHSIKVITTVKDYLSKLIDKEYYTKVLERCEILRDTIPYLDHSKMVINNKLCWSPMSILSQSKDIILPFLKDEGNIRYLVHGDSTLQNVLYDGEEVYFLDPRGFSWHEIYGDRYYDWAKIAYSLDGYEDLNYGNYDIKVKKNNFFYKIYNKTYPEHWDKVFKIFCKRNKLNEFKIKTVLALIWLRASGYLYKKNIETGLVAYLRGTELLNEVVRIVQPSV